MAIEEPAEVARRHPILGAAAQVAGVIGIVVCLVGAIGLVFGRGWAVDKVEELSIGVDSQVARAEPLLDTAAVKVGQVSDVVDTIVGAASAVGGDANPAPAVVDDVRAKVTSLGAQYAELRAQYAQIREQIVAASSRLDTLSALVPMLSLPQAPREALQALDARMQEIDAGVTDVLDLLATNPVASAARDWAASIADGVGGIAERVDRVEAAIAQVQQRLTALRADIVAKADTTQGLITVGALGTILVLLYLALVHAVLFMYGRQLRRRTAVPEPAPIVPAPVAPPA